MKPTQPIQIDTSAIKAKAKVATPKAAFSDVLGGVSAMGPATTELVGQWTGGSESSVAVLNAAFSGLEATAGSGLIGGGTSAGYSPYSEYPGLFGAPRFTSQPPGYASGGGTGKAANSIPGVGVSTNVDDPAQYQYEIMTSMNNNNLKLLELQALMQSNMQSWTTKSNILSADHRSRMSMIEKFSARG